MLFSVKTIYFTTSLDNVNNIYQICFLTFILPNSIRNVPTPAVQVTGVSPAGTPCLRLTVPYGIPVGVSKAGSKRVAASSASRRSGPLHGHPGSSSTPAKSKTVGSLKVK